MNIFKAALISIRRKKLNSIVLLLVIFVLANVVFTSYAVTSSLSSTKETVLAEQSPSVSFRIDYESVNPENLNPYPLQLDDALLLKEKTKNLVKTFDYSFGTSVSIPIAIPLFTIEIDEEEPVFNTILTKAFGTEQKYNYINVTGTEQLKTLVVANGNGKLIEGKGFSENDLEKGNDVVIITKQFAEQSGFKVGDTIPVVHEIYGMPDENVTGPAEELKRDSKIVGILQDNTLEELLKKHDADELDTSGTPKNSNFNAYDIMHKANTFYMPNSTISKYREEVKAAELRLFGEEGLPQKEGYNYEKAATAYIEPLVELKSIDNLEEFTKIAEEIYKNDGIKIQSSVTDYEKVAKPLESMNTLLNTILIVTIVSGIIIVSLILCIFIYLRKKEIGVILALGQKKHKIIYQLSLETLIITIIGSLLAIISGYFISNAVAENTVQKMLEIPVLPSEGFDPTAAPPSTINIDAIVKQFESVITPQIVLIFLAIMIITVIVAQLITVLYLLRFKPKKILM